MKASAAISALFAGLSIASPLATRDLPTDHFDISALLVQCQTFSCWVQFSVGVSKTFGASCVVALPGLQSGVPEGRQSNICDEFGVGFSVTIHDEGFGSIDLSVNWEYQTGKFIIGDYSIPGSQWQAFEDGSTILTRYTGATSFAINNLHEATSI